MFTPCGWHASSRAPTMSDTPESAVTPAAAAAPREPPAAAEVTSETPDHFGRPEPTHGGHTETAPTAIVNETVVEHTTPEQPARVLTTDSGTLMANQYEGMATPPNCGLYDLSEAPSEAQNNAEAGPSGTLPATAASPNEVEEVAPPTPQEIPGVTEQPPSAFLPPGPWKRAGPANKGTPAAKKAAVNLTFNHD